MTLRTRRIIFWALVAFFVILSPLVVFYSKGYRFDVQKLAVFKIGGLNLQVKTDDAKIFINDRLRAQSGGIFYSGSFFKLLPKTYNVRVVKDNYHSWQKKLTVKPNLVTDTLNIILFPQNIQAQKLISEEPIIFFSFSPTRSKILTVAMTKNATSSSFVFKPAILDIFGNPLENFSDFSLKWLEKPQIKILDGRWSSDGENFLLKIQKDKKIHWLLSIKPDRNKIFNETNISSIKTRELILVDEEIKKSLEAAKKTTGLAKISAPLDELFFNPQNSKELLFLLNEDVYSFNSGTKLIKNSKINNNPTLAVKSFLAEGKNIWWLDETGVIKKNDLNLNLIKGIFRIPDFASSSSDHQFINWNDTFAVSSKTETFVYQRSSGEFITLKGFITLARFSPDGKKLLYLKNDETIVVRYFEDIKTGDVKKAGDEDLIMTGVKDAAWHRSADYLILTTENSIKIAELDSRPERNILDLVKSETKIIFYNPDNEKIYFLDDSDGFLKIMSIK